MSDIEHPPGSPGWLGPAATVGIVAVLLAAWILMTPRVNADDFTAWMAPHRHAWYALPGVVLAFIGLGLLLVPVLLLIAATGVAFGPWLGPAYAMAGCLASASTGFAIGRWVGLGPVQRAGGARVIRLTRALERNGTLAVFLVRKVPAPFMLANIVIGAAGIRYRDLLAGTVLGMGALVVALAGFGYQFTRVLDNPSPAAVIVAAVAITVPLTVAWFINRSLRRSMPAS